MTELRDDETHVLAYRERLDALIAKGYGSLTLSERAEAEKLVEYDVDLWRQEVARMIAADIAARRITKSKISQLTGFHPARVSSMTGKPETISPRFLVALSHCVPGYGIVYSEFRRRADQLNLPGGQPSEDDGVRDARLRQVRDYLRVQLPALQDAVARLQRIADGGEPDGSPK